MYINFYISISVSNSGFFEQFQNQEFSNFYILSQFLRPESIKKLTISTYVVD